VEVLRGVWHRGRCLSRWILATTLVLAGCDAADPRLIPDEVLQSELGLTAADRVHTISLVGGLSERADPDSLSVLQGDFIQFVSADWLVHEVEFAVGDASGDRGGFLSRTGQAASPPLLQMGSRFVLSLAGAPPGAYPFALRGNGAPGHGVIVVREPEGR